MNFYFEVLLAGFIYIFTPGPIFLSIFALVTEQGRLKGYQLISGSMIGTALWLCFTIASIIEADNLPPVLFVILAIVAAAYLMWLGIQMFRRTLSKKNIQIFKRPFIDGILLGAMNPKSYPVMISVFTAIILNNGHNFTWDDFPIFFIMALSSFIIAEIILVAMAGIRPVSKFFMKHINYFSYGFGVLYIGFSAHLLLNTFYG